MEKLTAKACLRTAVNRQTRSTTDININTGDFVLVIRDGRGHWICRYRIIYINKKTVHVDQVESLVQYSIDSCKAYNVEDEIESIMNDKDNIAAVALQGDRHMRLFEKVQENEFWAIPGYEEDIGSIFVMRVIKFSDRRSKEPDFIEAKKRK